MDTKTGDWQRLGRYVKERREQLRLTQHAVTVRGGPSVATVRNIEAATAERYRGSTFTQLEDALGWERGSVDAILRGGDPTPLPAGQLPPEEPHPPTPVRKTLGDVLVARGLRRPDELVLSDDVVDPLVEELLSSTAFDEDFKDHWLSSYSTMRRQIFEATEKQKRTPRN
ncbi:helix-turn-helix domain-containing protein [Nonomuraea sp. CA-218870]|uniref:helix-turn-helix domain-containing protein n=1 Tax=Nonomuraea sp. CA-218870 TaxID=3239998 RepID=UPI003D8C0C15